MSVSPVGGSGDPARDGACTPGWLTDLIGPVGVDPCSNERSTVRAAMTHRGGPGDDGLEWASNYTADARSFVNPPYSRGQVARWVEAYRHTDFCFLLRWDPSTRWFRSLMPYARGVWFPHRRIDFTPPPGVKFSSNPFPHALYFRGPVPVRFLRHGTALSPVPG